MARWKTTEERFWSKVQRLDNGCLEWIGVRVKPSKTKSNGYDYGLFHWRGRLGMAHVYAWERLHGRILHGFELDHICGHRWCVEALHLQPLSHRENLLRSPHTQATINLHKTHCPQGHPYDASNTYVHNGQRFCRVCLAVHGQRVKARYDVREPARTSRVTHCPQGHEYTPENTGWNRGGRYCYACRRAFAKKYRALKKARKE